MLSLLNTINNLGKQVIRIKEVFMHPQYDHPDRANDIALLKLKEPAQFTDTVSPPCIPDQDDFGDESSFGAGMDCYLSGVFCSFPFIFVLIQIYFKFLNVGEMLEKMNMCLLISMDRLSN